MLLPYHSKAAYWRSSLRRYVVNLIRHLIVITVMYFDAYLKGRNQANTHLQSQVNPQSGGEPASKFTTLRPPVQQNSTVIGKHPYPELRSDNSKLNTSAHIFLSASKPSNLPQRVASNYPARPESNTAPLGPFSRHQLPEEQKYICHSPGKGGSRTSAGLVFEQIPQNRYDYRRSESITEMKPGETFRESSINYYNPTQRQTIDSNQEGRSGASTSPLPVKFNAYAGRVVRKESQAPLLTNRQQRSQAPFVKEPYSQKKLFKESYAELFQNKSQIPSFDPSKFQYIPSKADPADYKRYDFEGRRGENEVKKVDAYRTFQEICKNSSTGTTHSIIDSIDPLKKQSSTDLLKNYSNPKFPDLDKSLDQDIQILRYASRKSDEIIDREMSKNAYLNQLFEKATKTAEEKVDTIKEKKEGAAKNIAFERQLEGKVKEIEAKNKEIDAKNRQIDQLRKELQAKSKDLQLKDRQLEGKNKELQNKNRQLDCKRIELQAKSKELLFKDKELDAKNRQLEDKMKDQVEQSKEIFDKNKQISQKTKLIIDKNRQIELLSTEVKQLQTKLLKHQQAEFAQKINVESRLKDNLEKDAKIAELQFKIKKNEENASIKLGQQTRMIDHLKQQCKKKVVLLQNQLVQTNLINEQLQKTIQEFKTSSQDSQNKIQQLKNDNQNLKIAFNLLKQQSESEKLSLINLYKKQAETFRVKLEMEKQTSEKTRTQQSIQLQTKIQQFQKRASQAQQQLQTVKKQQQEMIKSYELLQLQYQEAGSVLLLGQGFTHEKLLGRLRECMEALGRSEGMQTKELQRVQEQQLQRLQQEHLQRRHQQLGRELKKVGSRLAGASMQAQQNNRLLRQANTQILLMNLMNLNQKYRFILENQ